MKHQISKTVRLQVVLATGLAFLAVGCVDEFTRSDALRPTVKMEQGKVISIARPANGVYDNKEIPGSGNRTAQALLSVFETKGKTTISNDCRDFDCLRKGAAFDYGVISAITHWEDHMTEYNGKRDYVTLALTVYNSRGQAIATTTINARSRWTTYGGITPGDLLVDPLVEYVNTLF